MKKKVDIALSTDPMKDLQEIIDYAKSVQNFADLLHCDVMDGKFVKNKTYDYKFVKVINAQTLLPLDVHLMTEEPLDRLEEYIKSGANILTVHYEAFKNKNQILQAISYIKSKGVLAGLSFKPSTTINDIKSFLFYPDIVLLMSVEPGKSGQEFMDETFEKVSQLNKFKKDNCLNFKIEIDGGINDKNAPILNELGADILVSGSFVYKSPDRGKAVKLLKNKA